MKIIVFHQYFSTNNGSYGTRIYEFCKNWVQAGHQVTVVTSVYYKSNLKGKSLGKEVFFDGIRVQVLNLPISNKDNYLKRIYYFVLYSVKASKFIFKEEYDIILASSGPITTGIPALIGKYFRRKKYIFEVRDLWPGVVEDIGIIKNPLVLKLSYWFESICYRNSSGIIVLSKGMMENICSRFSNLNIEVVTNSGNPDVFFRDNTEGLKSESYAKGYFLYTGNIGKVNNSLLLLKAAKKLIKLKRFDIQIVIIGDGQLKEEVTRIVYNLNLFNVSILDSVPKEKLREYYSMATASVIPLMNKKILDTSSPNKLFESLMMGIPIIQTTNGWMKDLLNDCQCGFTVSPINEDELANKMIELTDNSTLRDKMAKGAHALAHNNFRSDELAKKMINYIESRNDL
jgi:glycosyltransferase involved in cell wall biosynthesis